MGISLCLLIGCLAVVLPSCGADYIYFASHGGTEGPRRSGLYGGPIKSQDDGASSGLYSSGYQCAVLDKSYEFDSLNLRSVSYDPVSKDMLLHVNSQFTLLKSPVCRAQPPNCQDKSNYITPLFIKRVFSDEVKPVALFDSTVYFLRYKTETVNTKDKDATLELRKFTGCQSDYPVTGSTAFDLEACSELVATVHQERYKKAPAIKTTDHLLVIRDGRSLRFFTLLKHFTNNDNKYKLTLQLITVYGGKVEILDEQEVAMKFNMYSLNQLGGISFRDGVLCWSAVSSIICGDWRGDDLVNRRVILEDVAKADVCRASTDKMLANVSTGVAIGSVVPDLVVYFGCMVEIQDKGGMGMVRYKPDGSTQVFNVTNNGENILAGSMFVTNQCQSEEPPKPSNGNHQSISGGTKPTGEGERREPEPAGSSSASSANSSFQLFALVQVSAAAALVWIFLLKQ